ncbi:flagellar hook-length control protein FliK [Garciella nitratireducens]|uniref:flagellar hook-length control protein FliK n=1 Tax=Garciella nitratireducens TaxID=218205 RepID=UPI000DE9E07B|nr:flagellar hook-length control protein FliK [Garciella nitratireducens]RBP46761.1 flagellar hook-length control protein FliK [Garciella nitratireducens]
MKINLEQFQKDFQGREKILNNQSQEEDTEFQKILLQMQDIVSKDDQEISPNFIEKKISKNIIFNQQSDPKKQNLIKDSEVFKLLQIFLQSIDRIDFSIFEEKMQKKDIDKILGELLKEDGGKRASEGFLTQDFFQGLEKTLERMSDFLKSYQDKKREIGSVESESEFKPFSVDLGESSFAEKGIQEKKFILKALEFLLSKEEIEIKEKKQVEHLVIQEDKATLASKFITREIEKIYPENKEGFQEKKLFLESLQGIRKKDFEFLKKAENDLDKFNLLEIKKIFSQQTEISPLEQKKRVIGDVKKIENQMEKGILEKNGNVFSVKNMQMIQEEKISLEEIKKLDLTSQAKEILRELKKEEEKEGKILEFPRIHEKKEYNTDLVEFEKIEKRIIKQGKGQVVKEEAIAEKKILEKEVDIKSSKSFLMEEKEMPGRVDSAFPFLQKSEGIDVSTISENIQNIVEKIVNKIEFQKEGDLSSIQIQLKPEELGKMEIQLRIKDGEIEGKIFVESISAKNAIESQLQDLKERLKTRNIFLKDLNIDLQQKNQYEGQEKREGFFNQNQNSKNKFSRRTLRAKEENVVTKKDLFFNKNCYYHKVSIDLLI